MPTLPLAADGSTLAAPLPASVEASQNLPMFEEWAYDFARNELLLNEQGLPYLVEGNEALKIWLYWAVTTQKDRWRANSRDYGTEIERMIGLPVTTAIKSSELTRTIREAVAISPYVKRIKGVDVALEGGLVTVTVTVESVYEKGWVSISVQV